MLRFNTYRSKRYLRSKFVEGKFLLASEATDLELEILDQLRKHVQNQFGDAAIEDAWKVERLSDTEILIKPGEAWVKGFPFSFRSGKDHLVSGAIVTLGIVPTGCTVADDASGLGKIITFNDGASTPTNLYRVVVTAKEELLTDVEDPFLKNANLTESTAQKIRLVYQLNIVPNSLQTESPIPYRDETSTALSPTNFPSAGGFASPNLVNQITVTPTAAGNGELISTTLITGSEAIDGRDVEIVVRNNSGLGGGNPLPNSPTGQGAFSNGKLIDSNGSIYHVNAIFNDVVSTQLVIRLDKEPNQPNPEIINTKPFTLIKRDVFVTDDINGTPQGKLYWPIATVDFHTTNGITHDSKVVDLRKSVQKTEDHQEHVAQKMELIPTGGGDMSFNDAGVDLLQWTADILILNAFGPINTIEDNTAAIIEDGSLVYELDLESGGIISRGNLAVTVLSGGTTVTVNALDDLSDVRVGNIIRLGSGSSRITAINDVTKQLEVLPALAGTGAATIYLDSFADQTAPLSPNSYVLAVRKNNKVYVGGGSLELELGEISQLGDGVSQGLLTFIGSPDENDSTPNYSSTTVVTQGDSLVDAISDLDADVGSINNSLSAPLYDERILYPSGLVASTNIPIPNNSRDSGNPHLYDPGSGDMIVFLNQLIKFPGIDYVEVDNNTIAFNYDLPVDAEVRFRDAVLGGGGGGGGGSGSLQDAYNVGDTITTSPGNPFTVGGTATKVAVFNGDIEVTGVIDPTGIELTEQASNPLGSGKKGFWVNTSNEMVYENGTFGKNISQSIDDLESGVGVIALTRNYTNSTGSTILRGTPVYSSSAGNIAPANGNFAATSRVIGVAAEDINPASSGMIALYGAVSPLPGYTHGAYIYLGLSAGDITDVEPTLGPYPSGFNVILLGVMEGTNLILHIQNVGVL